MVRLDRRIPRYDLPGISRHSTKNRGHRAIGTVLGLVVWLVVANCIAQRIMLGLVSVVGITLCAARYAPRFLAANQDFRVRRIEIYNAACAMCTFSHFARATWN